MRWLVILAATVATGCADTDWSRNLYEGIRQQQSAAPDPHAVKPVEPQPDYDRYQREREMLKPHEPR